MRPHYQPLTVRLLCSSIITSPCTCLCAWPPLHTGTQVRLNIAAAALCTPHPPTPSFKPLIWSKLGTVARPAYRLALRLSQHIPFYRNMMTLQQAGITNRDLLAPEKWHQTVSPSDYSACDYFWTDRKVSPMSRGSL